MDSTFEITTVKSYLEWLSRICPTKQGGGVYSFMMKYGRQWQHAPLPDGIKFGQARQCFRNAAMLALDRTNDLTYVEGWAMYGIAVPVLHAWCVDRKGMVVDNTWRKTSSKVADYFGVPFLKTYLCRAIVLTGMYGLLECYHSKFALVRGLVSANLFLSNRRYE